ncbi:MAG: hypothetical protein U0324_47610 [Polyangiales bacterium]
MKRSVPKNPEADAPLAGPKTFTSPPRFGTGEVWSTLQSAVDAVPAERVQKPRVDLQAAAVTALSVCDDVRDDAALYARFLKQAEAGEFDAEGFRKLQQLAGGAWHARRMQLRAESGDTEETVPAALIEAGDELVGRMLPVARYHLAKVPAAASVVAGINTSRGHMRLANNLLNLAELYQTHRAVIEGDRVNYRATDADEAGRVASAIVTSLADTSAGGADVWGDRCARVWTLLSDCYEQVQAVGHYLLRATPDAARERFPSLVAGSRATPSRKDATPAQPAADPATPGQPAADPQPAAPTEPATPRAAATPKRKRRTR